MPSLHGHSQGPLILLHGGEEGPEGPTPDWLETSQALLASLAADAFARVSAKANQALDAVESCLRAMEEADFLNAGRGACRQSDGAARLTASLMDGPRKRFTGVTMASDMIHPSQLARALQGENERVLAPPGVATLARKYGIAIADPFTPERGQQWLESKAKKAKQGSDTVGCLILTGDGRLYGGLSTGGSGNDTPGRVSDAASVSGLYVTDVAGIACTGIGEHIWDDAVAAKTETRRRDGLSLTEACERTLAEAEAAKHSYGWLALDREGHWGVYRTIKTMAFLVYGPQGVIARGTPPAEGA